MNEKENRKAKTVRRYCDIQHLCKPFKITQEEINRFNRNFNREVFEKAKNKIQQALLESNSLEELWSKLKLYQRDIKYRDIFSVLLCEVELDRSKMETTADYVGVCFFIYWNEKKKKGNIKAVELYSSDSYNGDVLYYCTIDPNTCEIISTDQIQW